MDALIQVSVSMPDKPLVGYKIRVTNVYGTITRAADSDQLFLNALMGGLRKAFGGSVKVESLYHDESETAKPAVKRGRPRKT